MASAAATQQAALPPPADPCVDAGTRLCTSLEECLIAIVTHHSTRASSSPSSSPASSLSSPSLTTLYAKLQSLIEDLFVLLHYHVTALSGKPQCLQVEGILYRHLQLVSCRVVAAFLKEEASAGKKKASAAAPSSSSSSSSSLASSSKPLLSEREALLSGGLSMLMGVDSALSPLPLSLASTAQKPVLPSPSSLPPPPPPPVAILSSWLASLLPDVDNARCYHTVPQMVLLPSTSSNSAAPSSSSPQQQHQQQAPPPPLLAHQLRRLLSECVGGNSMSATMPSTHPSAPFYPTALASGSNGLSEAARRFASITLRPIILTPAAAPSAAANATAAAGAASASSAPQQPTTARGRGTQQPAATAAASAQNATAPTATTATAAANNSSRMQPIPDNCFVYVPRLALPVYYPHLIAGVNAGVASSSASTALSSPSPQLSAHYRVAQQQAGAGGIVEGPVNGMLVPSYYHTYRSRIISGSNQKINNGGGGGGEERAADPALARDERLQQVLFELSKDQKLERDNIKASLQPSSAASTTKTTNAISLSLRQKHWRRSDPFLVVRDAATRYEDACHEAEEEAEAYEDDGCNNTTANSNGNGEGGEDKMIALLSTRLARKRSRVVENAFSLLVTNEWLRGTLDEMLNVAMFSSSDDKADTDGDDKNKLKFDALIDTFVSKVAEDLSAVSGGGASAAAITNRMPRKAARVERILTSTSSSSQQSFRSLIATIERNKLAPQISACRDTEKVVRFSRSLLYTPAVEVVAAPSLSSSSPSSESDAAAASIVSNEVADRLWALNKLYFSRRAPDEGNTTSASAPSHNDATTIADVPQLPIEPRATMPCIFKPIDVEGDMFSGLRSAETTTTQQHHHRQHQHQRGEANATPDADADVSGGGESAQAARKSHNKKNKKRESRCDEEEKDEGAADNNEDADEEAQQQEDGEEEAIPNDDTNNEDANNNADADNGAEAPAEDGEVNVDENTTDAVHDSKENENPRDDEGDNNNQTGASASLDATSDNDNAIAEEDDAPQQLEEEGVNGAGEDEKVEEEGGDGMVGSDGDNASSSSYGDDDEDGDSDEEDDDDEDSISDEDEVPPPPVSQALPASSFYIPPQNRLTLLERIGVEYGIRNKLL